MCRHASANFLSKKVHMFNDIVNYFFEVGVFVEELGNPVFKKILDNKHQQFDLILLECVSDVLFGLAEKFGVPIICLSSLGALSISHDLVGNPTHPVLQRQMFLSNHEKDVSLWMKTQLVLVNVLERLYINFLQRSSANKLSKEFLNLELSTDFRKKVAMLFLNVNPVLHQIRADVPGIVNMGMVHIEPKQPLPNDLQQFLDNGQDGVLYFSLGSFINIEDTALGQKIIDSIIQLPFKMLLKWKCNNIKQARNIICREWFPQQDVLAHSNIKIFISQGGLHSMEEAISRKVPLLVLPFMADQHLNTQKIIELGIGVALDPEDVQPESVKEKVLEVVENPKYKTRIAEVSKIINDRAMSGLDKAVWWAEHVIRHKGAWHLRSPTVDISWFSYLLLDVVVSLVVAMTAIIYFSYILFQLFKKSSK